MLRLFYALPPENPDAFSDECFSEYRRERLASLRAEKRRGQSVAAELLLIHAVRSVDASCELPLKLMTDPQGKPAIAGNALYFSLSHTEGFCVCAVGDRELGVDTERKRPYREALVRRFFHEEERRLLLRADDPAECFTLLWTLKESYLKALGCGLTRPLDSLCLYLEPHIGLAGDPSVGFWHGKLDGFHVSLCVPGCPEPIPEIVEEVKLL